MSSKFRVLAKICSSLFLLMGLSLWAQDNFVLVTSPAKVQDVCGRHGLTQLTQGSSHGVFLVSTSSVDPSISTDSAVQVLSTIALSACLNCPGPQMPA